MGRSILAVLVGSMVLAAVGVRPAAAAVTSVSGSAFGFKVNVGLFGGPRNIRGAGTGVATTDESYSPSVTLPGGGSATAITAGDPDGGKGVYGPAVIFGGQWPDWVAAGPSSGPQSVSTQGTAAGGSVTSSASIVKHPPPGQEVGCYTAGGFTPPCYAPGGIGPGPLIADEAHSTCTADASGVSGSATFVNGKVETKYDASSQLAIPEFVVPMPNPVPPNWTISGTIDHVGDHFTIVLNEQIIGPDSITVNAAHMYLLGAVARGDMIVGQSTCAVTNDAANGAPSANDDAFSTAEDTPVTIAAPGLLANDTDPDGNPLTATHAQAVLADDTDCCRLYTFPSDPVHGSITSSAGAPLNGSLTINGNGSLTYTPDKDYFGTDTFTYVARDARGANDPATVTVTVTPVPDDPVAVDDVDQTVVNTPLVVVAPGVLANDTDGDGDTLTAGSASDPPHGTVALNADGSYTYTPDAGYLGPDSFTYTINDGTGRSDTASVALLVTVDGATLLKDIRPGNLNSSPTQFRLIGSTLFFSADNGVNGRELWKTDGTADGTVMVKDINTSGTPAFASGNPTNLTDVNGTLFFAATNSTNAGFNGVELWKSDGTTAGTVLVKDINVGIASSSPANFAVIGSTLYFSASNGTAAGQNGVELWKSDGTNAGTVPVKDINVGTASSSPGNLAVLGTTLYFTATDGATSGVELWKSDGTTANTVMVKDINSGAASSSPANFTALGTTLYFRATTAAEGAELWRSDGTTAGTVLVKDINVGTAGSIPQGFTVFGSTLLFSANDGDANFGTELWKTDGTTAGTVMVANLNSTSHASPNGFKVFGSIVLFSANGGTGGQGFELWKTDGTELGTVLVKDINPGVEGSNPSSLTVMGGVVYFSATTATKGAELWKTDGTAAGTVMSEDINPGTAGSSPTGLTPAFGTMLFSANEPATSTELWRLAVPPQATPAGALPANADRVSEIAKSAGSDTTYPVLNNLAQAFNESQGCEAYGAVYGAGPGFEPNAPQTCAPDASQPASTVVTENYDHDVVANYFPTGSTDGFRQLCRREATSVQNIQFARSSSSPSAQAPNCTTANGGDSGTVFRWVSFAAENLGWATWAGGHSVNDLTVAQLQGIFVTCTITNWSQLGGPNEPIRVFAPQANSGSLATWEVLLGGNLTSCIPAAFKDGNQANGERLVREHQAVDVEVVDTAAEAVGLGTCAGQPGCATADLERWSVFASFSCAVWTTQPAHRSASLMGSVAGQGCASASHPAKRNLSNVFATTPGTGYPGTSSAVRRFTDMRPAFPPANPTVNGYLCMPLSKHSKPAGDPDPGTALAGASKNYGMEKQAVLQTSGFTLHKDDAAYAPGGVTDPNEKPFCKQAEWLVNAAGPMTFTGTNQGLPGGS